MITVKDIYNYIDEVAPFNTQLPYDNAGVLIGDFGKEVKKIGFCLDVTNEIVEKAVESEIDLIVSHHPVIFNKLFLLQIIFIMWITPFLQKSGFA